ncbi:MAG: DUF3365 domain-containing protein [Ignavibacteriaceae bacterium]|nr:DUF3365 domain-containing protein [Ignavibacteriaceae bacterium]
MKSLVLIIALSLTFVITSCKSKTPPEITDQVKSGLKSDAQNFMKTLKGVLIREIESKGIINAVSVCSDTAQLMTNNYGVQKGIFIKRVSFKNRNPVNKPDEIESNALKKFEELKAEGKLNPETAYFETIEEEGVTKVRYLVPIILQPECLNCHGDWNAMDPEVKKIISDKYPEDKAVDYKVGDLRGAVSIEKVISK